MQRSPPAAAAVDPACTDPAAATTITDITGPHALHTGDRFDSFAEFEQRLRQHCAVDFVTYWRRDSRTVHGARMKTARPIAERLHYYSVRFACVHGGQKFDRRGCGRRLKPTMRSDCPAHIALRATKCGQQLEVVAACNRHNHAVTESGARALPQNRRLTDEVRGQVLQLMRQQVNAKLIRDYVNEATGMQMTCKELGNLRQSLGATLAKPEEIAGTATVPTDDDFALVPPAHSDNVAENEQLQQQRPYESLVIVQLDPMSSNTSVSSPSQSPDPHQSHDNGYNEDGGVDDDLLLGEMYYEVMADNEYVCGDDDDNDADDLNEERLLDSTDEVPGAGSPVASEPMRPRLQSIEVERLAGTSPTEYLQQLTPESADGASPANFHFNVGDAERPTDAPADMESLEQPAEQQPASSPRPALRLQSHVQRHQRHRKQRQRRRRPADLSSELLRAEIAVLRAEKRKLTAETQLLRLTKRRLMADRSGRRR